MDTTTSITARRWGAIIKERRTFLGWSQYALADKLDTRQSTVSGWERGTRLPSRRNLAILCDILGLPESVFRYEVAA